MLLASREKLSPTSLKFFPDLVNRKSFLLGVGLAEKIVDIFDEKNVSFDKIKSGLDDLANLSSDELIEIFDSNKLKKIDADEIIMKARENWFKEDKKENIKETSKK